MKKVTLFLLLQVLCFNLVASEAMRDVIKETHLYSVKGSDSLRLDRYYVVADSSSQELNPAIIFMFGGAFFTGVRDKEYFIPCFEYYAKRGYEVFSIDYRLGLKDAKLKSVKPLSKFISIIDHTVNIAVEDLYDATTFIINKSEQWSINPEMIVPFGSSAGGITVLHAEYYRANSHPLTSKLPADFQYGGIISMAGAIFSMNGNLKWEKKVAPILMFQGSADSNVPYNKKRIFKYGFFGSKAIAKSLSKIESPYYFCTFYGAAHEIAGLPMNENREDIDAFLAKLVVEKLPLEIIKTSINTSKPKVEDRFTMKDYLKANFAPRDTTEGRVHHNLIDSLFLVASRRK